MSTEFKIYGPFPLKSEKSKKGEKMLEQKNIDEFFADTEIKKLAQKKGCYVFVTKASKGYKPWYVGKTIKQTLEKECFNPRNINVYQNVILKTNGLPMIYFVIPEEFNKNAVDELEKYLTMKASEKNENIYNRLYWK